MFIKVHEYCGGTVRYINSNYISNFVEDPDEVPTGYDFPTWLYFSADDPFLANNPILVEESAENIFKMLSAE